MGRYPCVIFFLLLVSGALSDHQLKGRDGDNYSKPEYINPPDPINYPDYSNQEERWSNEDFTTQAAGDGGNEDNGQSMEGMTTPIPVDLVAPFLVSHQPNHNKRTNETKAKVVTIAVLGRSGSGVSSTIQKLIGQNAECSKPEGNETFPDIFEYTITDDGSLHQLKILDVPGFVDGRNLEQESQILASLKYYVQTAENPPDFYLGLTKFDDNRIDGIHSLFVQFLKRVELFHDAFLNNTNTNAERNVVFPLTHLMSETRAIQRKPEGKIGQFRKIIQEYTRFPPYISTVVSRESQLQCEAKLISPAQWEHFEDDADAFYYLLTLRNMTIEENEINRKVEEAFEKNGDAHVEEIVQKIALQLRLQQENITSTENLPKTVAEQAAFFQNNKQVSATIPAFILNDAFNLTMPKYEQELTVGYGYVLMSDEMATRSPFAMATFQPSSIGYQIPNYMKCRKLVRPEIQYFKSYSANMSDYIEERLKYLDFKGKDNTTVEGFTVEVKEGFNLQPEEGEDIVSLTAVEEHRTLTCKLASNRSLLSLNPEFILEVDSLMRFDKHDRDSVNDWKYWFNKWGSHIIVHSYGGGTLYGSIEGAAVRNVLKAQSSIKETLNSIINFTPFSVDNLGMPNYRPYGGQSTENNARLYNLSETARKEVLEKWKESLNADFIMLTNEFRLQPISELITEKIGIEKGQIVDEAIELLLKGELKYSRRRKVPTKMNRPTEANGTSDHESGVEAGLQHQPTTPSETLNSHLLPHSSGNSGGTYPDLQNQINNYNEQYLEIERKRAEKKIRDDEERQRELEQQRELQQERDRQKERQRAMEEERLRKAKQRQEEHQVYLENLQRQGQAELDLLQRQVEEAKRRNEEDERQHRLWMAEIKNKPTMVPCISKSTAGVWGNVHCRNQSN